VQNTTQGFPDDTASPGPTIIGNATLATIANWYEGLSIDEVRRRFRTNIEITGVAAFWEDQLFTNSPRSFQMGNVELQGINPCQRCVVPTRDAATGIANKGFQQTFGEQRRVTLPLAVDRSRFNHFYRVAVNTRISTREAGKLIRVGDAIIL
jgi:uncharacterized protein